ncbi:16S rRNA (adenine(1518)-N(6)/adenine(1519)-N(6))-dimethyltransferase RsmA [Portibacter marinus]|uniref:16S rRNA (adenine(1518)-N(6)/adenine(1519)-N(6))- dimethyltransferase RsmA n=1 Tax=Portibacter marinus TaxID=2898660 RepID=UPI001F3E3791|nr:16S rRNA (adenine(1518)-N(6)/adenine(1519)-N(6))-dimethyltransferase RsmA [Portibacter marinus]
MGYKAKKSYGQHFLTDLHLADQIVEALTYTDGMNVLEVGPGQGVLTEKLKRKGINLKLIEADMDMVTVLHKKFPDMEGQIIHFDFLKADLRRVFDHEPLAVIGNFPYNISSQIVFRIIKYFELVPEMVGMFQWEVAQRIVSEPGSKKYGVISVLTQAIYEGELLFKVPPNVFNPPPKVDSGVIKLTRKKNLEFDYNRSLFKHIVKTAFNQRRKMLRNTLKSMVQKTNFQNDELLMKRPEQLSVQDYIYLTKNLDHES